jgi:hypothetical protein
MKVHFCSFSPIKETELLCFKDHRLHEFLLLIKCSIKMEMNMEHWWNFADRGKLKYLEKPLPVPHFIKNVTRTIVRLRQKLLSKRPGITVRANFKTNLLYITRIWSLWTETSC